MKKYTLKILNKHFMLVTPSIGAPRIEPNVFELLKQYAIMEATNIKLPLPRFGYSEHYKYQDDYPDLDAWYCAVKKYSREFIETLDFSKPFNPEVFVGVSEKESASKKKMELNADDLINAELDE